MTIPGGISGISAALVSTTEAFAVAVVLAFAGVAIFCPAPADAETLRPDSIESSFPSNSNPSSSPVARLSSPLSGSVRVIDQLSKPTRLKRSESTAPAIDQSGGVAFPTVQEVSSGAGQGGSMADSGLQALFPSKDSFNPPPSLSGFAGAGQAGKAFGAAEQEQVKPKKKHTYIWNMSLAGGYYDVTNTFQGVVPGDKLYLYGGFMADGHTPVPTGPTPMNHGGHIRWTPTMGLPPGD